MIPPISLPGEVWKDIPGYEGLYMASNLGRIKSLSRPAGVRGGYTRLKKERILADVRHHSGYSIYVLRKDGKSKSIYGHALVMLAFAGPRPDGMEVCHYDGNKANGALSNLRYDTGAANEQDKRRHGTYQEGELSPSPKLTEKDVISIRERRAAGEECAFIGLSYGMGSGHISKICTGEAWACAPGPITRSHYRVRVPQHRFSADAIVEIRMRRASGEWCKHIAADYGCDESYVSSICTGDAYPSAGGPITRKRYLSTKKVTA